MSPVSEESALQKPALEEPLDVVGRMIRSERVELVHVARREGLGSEDAIDAVHDALCTFLKLAQRKELPDDPSALPAFLAGIVRNAARNKRRLHHVARPHHDVDAIDRIDGTDEELATDAMVELAEEHVRLRACVDRLCDTQKAVVTLRLLEEQRGEDVATTLGISRGYVDVLLHRAKHSLRACMMED